MQKPTNGEAIEKRLIPVKEYEMLLKCKEILLSLDCDPYGDSDHLQILRAIEDRDELLQEYFL